jgi:membrane-associated phospholipid phosphatase
MKKLNKIAIGLMSLAVMPWLQADEVTDWNENMLQAALVAGTSPMVTSRAAAMVQTAVFDALNGIERRYTPIHVTAEAPRGASRRAAVAQAAYTILVDLFPPQKADLDAKLASSLAALMDQDGDSDEESILRGVTWGQSVANAIWTWRSADGFTPPPSPFLGGTAVGEWRPTPPAFASGATPQFATMVPWSIQTQSQFRPDGPPALSSSQWAADFNETKSMGSSLSLLRSADQTLLARFWNASTVTYYWNNVAVNLATERHFTMSESAHLLALLNVAVADAVIACWAAKYHYVAWRPVTAIPLADTDGNASTDADPLWAPLLVTPAHPEYPSGHSTTSGAAAAVLVHFFGEQTAFTVDSNVMLGATRSFTSFSAAQDEIANARIFGGIHFRSACVDGRATGGKVASYVLAHTALIDKGHGHENSEHDGDHGRGRD